MALDLDVLSAGPTGHGLRVVIVGCWYEIIGGRALMLAEVEATRHGWHPNGNRITEPPVYHLAGLYARAFTFQQQAEVPSPLAILGPVRASVPEV